jgi:hypothetical protein
MSENSVIVPRSFINNNTSFLQSRSKFFSDVIKTKQFDETMKEFNSAEFLYTEVGLTVQISENNIELFKNLYQKIKSRARLGNLIDDNNPDWIIESQVEYLTQGENDFLEELYDLHDTLLEYEKRIDKKWEKYHCGNDEIEDIDEEHPNHNPLDDLPF